MYGQLISETVPIRIVWTINFGEFISTGVARKHDLWYCMNLNFPHIDLESGIPIGIVRTIGFGYCLLTGIARTIDLEGGLLLGIVRIIDYGDFPINWNCLNSWLRTLSINETCRDDRATWESNNLSCLDNRSRCISINWNEGPQLTVNCNRKLLMDYCLLSRMFRSWLSSSSSQT